MKLKIAYYEEKDCHTEVFGTFLDFFNSMNCCITLFNNIDKSNYVQYYKKFVSYDIKTIHSFKEEYDNYDIIIIGTSSDISNIKDIIYLFNKKLIYISHLQDEIKLLKESDRIIVFTPLNIITNYNINYLLPIHSFYNEVNYNKENIISIVGRFKNSNRDIKTLINFIKENNNIIINIFSRHQKFVPSELLTLSSQFPQKLKIYLKLNGEQMEKQLIKSKFILTLAYPDGIYHKDRMSGTIPLAYNYNIPLIIDKKLNDIYNFTSPITYNNDLIEVTDIIKDNINYKNIVDNVVIEKNKIIADNKKVLVNVCKTIK